MEYFSYILIILAILAIILLAVRLPGRTRLSPKPLDLSDRARRHRAKVTARERKLSGKTELELRHKALQRDVLKVRTPWGWPGHDSFMDSESSGTDRLSASLYRSLNRLLRRKRTVDDREFRSRKAASLRALLEDRYGRASGMRQLEYQKTRRPLLRDPSEPHDQMDNFPSGKGDEIAGRLTRQAGIPEVTLAQTKVRKVSGLEKIKTPWGW